MKKKLKAPPAPPKPPALPTKVKQNLQKLSGTKFRPMNDKGIHGSPTKKK